MPPYLSLFIFKGHFECVAPTAEKPTHFTDEKVLTETDKDDWVSGMYILHAIAKEQTVFFASPYLVIEE